MNFTTTATASAHFEAQDSLAPGTEGFWKVWGARPFHAQAGDLLVTKAKDSDDLHYDLLTEVDKAEATFTRYTNAEGETFRIGNLFAGVIILRWGTKNTLA